MNHLSLSCTAWLSAPGVDAAVWGFVRSGLALLLQTTLLLAVGLWTLHLLRRRGSRVSGLVARALLVAVLVSVTGGAVINARLAPEGGDRVRSLWNVALPREATAAAPIASEIQSVPAREVTPNKPLPGYAVQAPVPQPGAHETALAAAEPNKASLNLEASETTANGNGAIVATTTSSRSKLVAVAATVWLGVSAALLAWLAACHIALLLLRRGARPVSSPEMSAVLSEVCAALEVRAPRLLQHRRVGSPLIAGLWQPTILLPAGDAMEGPALRAVLLHEAAHLKRGDLWWNAAGRIGCALLWPQPLLWLLCRRLEEINEEECDEAVLYAGCERSQYARCLLEWAERMTVRRAERVAGAGVLTGRSSLSRRVQLILDNATPSGRRVSARLRWAAALGIALAVVAMPLMVSIDAAPRAGGAKSAGGESEPRGLVHSFNNKRVSIIIGGVSMGQLDLVAIMFKNPRGLVYQTVVARRAQLEMYPVKGGFEPFWHLSDVTIEDYDEVRGISGARRHVAKYTERLHADSAFMERQLQARPEAAKEQYRDLLERALPSRGEWNAVRAWAKNHGNAMLVGQVRDDEGKPVAGAKIDIDMKWESRDRIDNFGGRVLQFPHAFSRRERGLFSQSTVSDSRGNYRFTGLAGAYEYHLGISPHLRNTAASPKVPVAFRVPFANYVVTTRERATVTAPRLVLTRGGLVHFRLVDAVTGAPLPGISIGGGSYGPPPGNAPSYRLDSDGTGEALFRLPAGEAHFEITDYGGPAVKASGSFGYGIPNSLAAASITVDGARRTPDLDSINFKLAKGQTHEVVVRVTSKEALRKAADARTRAAARPPLVHESQTPARHVTVGGVADGVLQCLSVQDYQKARVTRIVSARTARRQAGSAKWVLQDVVITTFGSGNDSALQSQLQAQRLEASFPGADAFLVKQTRARNEPAQPDQWDSLRKAQLKGTRDRSTMQSWAHGRGRAAVTGQVIDEDGRPVRGAKIAISLSPASVKKIVHSDGGFSRAFTAPLPDAVVRLIYRNAVTDSNGNYSASGLAGGFEYEMGLLPYGMPIQRQSPAPLPPTVELADAKVMLRDNATTEAPSIKTTRGGLVAVRVVDMVTGAAIPGVIVSGHCIRRGITSRSVNLVETNASGTSAFRLPAGPANIYLTVTEIMGQQRQPPKTHLHNGIRYSLKGNLKMNLDRGKTKPCAGSIDVQIEQGRTHELVVRLPRYVAPRPDLN